MRQRTIRRLAVASRLAGAAVAIPEPVVAKGVSIEVAQ
jgi:hypothetical protein